MICGTEDSTFDFELWGVWTLRHLLESSFMGIATFVLGYLCTLSLVAADRRGFFVVACFFSMENSHKSFWMNFYKNGSIQRFFIFCCLFVFFFLAWNHHASITLFKFCCRTNINFRQNIFQMGIANRMMRAVNLSLGFQNAMWNHCRLSFHSNQRPRYLRPTASATESSTYAIVSTILGQKRDCSQSISSSVVGVTSLINGSQNAVRPLGLKRNSAELWKSQ